MKIMNFRQTLLVAFLLAPLAFTSSAANETPYAPKVELSREAVHAGPPTYVPAQTFTAFPERMLPSYQSFLEGIKELAPDNFVPVEGGIALQRGKKGSFVIHHRRAGVRCHENLVFQLRLEMVQQLASLRLALEVGERFVWLSELPLKQMTYFPGRVRYELEDAKLQLAVVVEVVAPAVTPAYGFIAKVSVANLTGQEKELKLLALGSAGKVPPTSLAAARLVGDYLRIDCSKETAGMEETKVKQIRSMGQRIDSSKELAAMGMGIPYDTNLSLLVGWDSGEVAAAVTNAATRTLRLSPNGKAEGQLTAFLDSPGYDEQAMRQRIAAFFNRRSEIPEAVRQRMIEEAIDTHARVLVDGDRKFAEVRNDGGKSLAKNLQAWANGVQRQSKVRFELSDKKMESLANLCANDLFPGLVQPPGMVHDAKDGDYWNYIFCYDHVHAANDLALEPRALDYLNMLSCNQKPDGGLVGVMHNFKTDAHPTRWEESYIDAIWHYYKWTGDLESVRRQWSTMTRAAAWLDKKLDPDGDHLYKDSIHQWKSDFDNRGPSSAFQTALVFKAYRDLAELARKLGKPDEAQRFLVKSQAIQSAAMRELWSNEFGILGSKCPLGLLRLHPQCLDVEIPIWTGLVDGYQGVMLADWIRNNSTFTDKQGGLYFYTNEWWPVVFSQHQIYEGDMLMTGWGLMLAGRHEDGFRTLETAAAMAYRSSTPGFDQVIFANGTGGTGRDWIFTQGPFVRTLVEGLFGISPHFDENRVVIHPRFPEKWDHARFTRSGLDIAWQRNGQEQTFRVTTAAGIRCRFEIPVNSALTSVMLDGKPVKTAMKPGMGWAILDVETGGGGGELKLITSPRSWRIDAPATLQSGQTAEMKLSGLSAYEIEDPYGFFEVLQKSADRVKVRLKRAGSGQATLFVRCTTGRGQGSITWTEPINLITLPRSAKEVTKQTVLDTVPAHSKLLPLDLSAAYNNSIQTCFLHSWKTDAADVPSSQVKFWTMPLFKLTAPLPREVTVGNIPFLLGEMKDDLTGKNLILLDNTPPRTTATGATLHLDGRTLRKAYLLSLNMNLPMKAYTPAATVTVRYTDGSQQVTELIPPVNFDSYYQDFAINTVSFPLLCAEPAHGMKKWSNGYNCDFNQMHLTMTDVLCDPAKKVDRIEFRSVATETFMGIAGVTLLEALPGGKEASMVSHSTTSSNLPLIR
jgi:hypothetical protein